MLLEEELVRYSTDKETILTIGVFDGVHLGHKSLFAKLAEQANHKNLLTGVITFYQHPEELLIPKRKMLFLTDIQERTRLLKEVGIDIVIPLSFTKELADLDARHFISLLQEHLKMRGLVIGPDFALGKDREGDIPFLTKMGQREGFTVTVVPPLVMNDEIVSSTAIRKALAEGDLDKVRRFSGRPFSLHGLVVSGTGRGTGLGFPTANITVGAQHALPPDGVYACYVQINNKEYLSMTNIGKCPTFGNWERTIETYIIDFKGDIYGNELRIEFIARIRGEKKFESVEALRQQIASDVAKGKAILEAAKADMK